MMKKTLDFLSRLKANNHRDWFQAHRAEYDETFADLKKLFAAIKGELGAHDLIDERKSKIFRINRDVRFSKNKAPYNVHRSAFFRRAGEERRGSYYLRIENGGSLIAGGFFGPNPQDLLHIRKQVQQDPDLLRDVLNARGFSDYFGKLNGDQVKTSPKGFSKEDPAINLLRHKQFYISHDIPDRNVCQNDFVEQVVTGFVKMRPFLDCMTEYLTTDLNGEPLI